MSIDLRSTNAIFIAGLEKFYRKKSCQASLKICFWGRVVTPKLFKQRSSETNNYSLARGYLPACKRYLQLY